MKSIIIFILLIFCNFGIKALGQEKGIREIVDTTNCLAHDTIVQIIVEKNAEFQDGDILKFRKYIMMHIRYPLEALIIKRQGKSYIKFVVDWDGQVKDVTVYKSSGDKFLDDEAVRLIKQSPLWKSAKNNKICVPQQFIIPIGFELRGMIN